MHARAQTVLHRLVASELTEKREASVVNCQHMLAGECMERAARGYEAASKASALRGFRPGCGQGRTVALKGSAHEQGLCIHKFNGVG